MHSKAKLKATLLAALSLLNTNRSALPADLAPDSLLPDSETSDLIAALQADTSPTVQVVLSGGLLRCASSDNPLAALFAVETLDFDIDGSEPDTLATPSEALPHESPAGVFANAEPVTPGAFYTLSNWPGFNQ